MRDRAINPESLSEPEDSDQYHEEQRQHDSGFSKFGPTGAVG
jgi:hypothetical protein